MTNLPKRDSALFIPYRFIGGVLCVYLQKRSKDAPRLPNIFGFFGGGIEGDENLKEALLREIKEELAYTPSEYTYLSEYSFSGSIKHVFYTAVNDNFESQKKGVRTLS